MPISLLPNKSFDYSLKMDIDYFTPETMPIFKIRYLTGREWLAAAELADQFDRSVTAQDRMTTALAVVRIGLSGWVRMGDPYDPEQIDAKLSIFEIIELMQAVIGQNYTTQDKKKAVSP